MSALSDAIDVSGVSVRYRRKVAVDDVTFTVQRGSVYAMLGRNGAGKSSLVRCILGQQKPNAGRVMLLGEDVWTRRAKLMERIGVVSEDADAPPEMRVEAIARFSARFYPRWENTVFADRLRRFGIAPGARFGELSKGQKKQVALALALASQPELLVLDDPTLGLDVVARKSLFEEVIAELADRGITVLITTHDLAGVETIADRIGILSAGKLVLDEELESIKSRFRRIRFAARPLALAGTNLNAAAVRTWGNGTEAVITNYDESALEQFQSADVAALSLEEIFLAVAGEKETS